MIFADETDARKGQIIGRAWSAIGIPPEHCTDELMAEWIGGLYELTLDQIAVGVAACKALGRTAPIDEFVTLCKTPRTGPPKDLSTTETKRESYDRLNLAARYGPAPKEWP